MKLPFSGEAFLENFGKYNTAVFPIQIIFYVIAFTAIYFTLRRTYWSGKIISGILSFFWFWMGAAYHLTFFATINKAAYLFGALFILQGVLFLWKGIFQSRLSFLCKRNIYSITGIALCVFSLIIYPVLGYFSGHVYPANPTFGLPCPTTIFTFGVLLMTDKKLAFIIFIIPVLWSIIGLMAAFSLGIKEDVSLLVAALLAVGLLFYKKINKQT